MVDGTGTTAYTYHPAGALGAGQVATVDGPLTNDVVSYAYDALVRVVTRAIDDVPLTYTYDALGRVQQEVNVLGTFAYTYDGVSGRLAHGRVSRQPDERVYVLPGGGRPPPAADSAPVSERERVVAVRLHV